VPGKESGGISGCGGGVAVFEGAEGKEIRLKEGEGKEDATGE